MENCYTHTGLILYHLSTSFEDNVFEITLKTINETGVKIFKESLVNGLPFQFKKVENFYLFLKNKKNFVVDPIKGRIILKIRKMVMDDIVEEKEEI